MAFRNLLSAGLVLVGLACPVLAEEPMYYAPGGIAMSGYDVVAYFTKGEPVEGMAAYAVTWRGATWYFSSPESLMAFEMNPEAYAPQFGGYCAYAVAEGRTGPVDPDAFFVRDGRLYFLHDTRMLGEMQDDLPRILTEAQANWPAALGD